MIRSRVVVAALVVAVLIGIVVSWRASQSEDPMEAYCAEVRDNRQAIGEELAEGGATTGLLNALPAFEALAKKAPDDIADEWQIVLERLHALSDAIEEAGSDPATYDRKKPPAGVTPAQRRRIDGAAAALSTPASQQAFASVAQHARDVCHTPLYL